MSNIDHDIFILAVVLLEVISLPFLSSRKCDHCGNRMVYRRHECSACGVRYTKARSPVGHFLNILIIALLLVSLWLPLSGTINVRTGLFLLYLVTSLFIIELLRAIIPGTSPMRLDHTDTQTKLIPETTGNEIKRAEP